MAGGEMRAAFLSGIRDLKLKETELPGQENDHVLIKIAANGICGSDIHFYEDGKLGPFVVDQPYIPGHEASGVVVSGPVGKAPQPGQRVAIEPGIPCRTCSLCKSGRYNLCTDVRFLSAPPENGTFADFVSIPWDFAHPLPDSINDETGAFVEPVSVAIQACERGGLTAGNTVLIVGAGPIGLVLALVTRAYGASRVYIVDVQNNRLRLAKEIGADRVFNPADEDLVSACGEATNGGADIVFDTSGSSTAAAGTPLLAARGGRVVLVGWPERGSFEFPVEIILEKELDIRGVNRYCNTYSKAISILGELNIDKLISHRFPFEDVAEAFRFTSANRNETVKVMVSHGAGS
ncbi:MAG: NAD(P)-dependent alcohol dehydrogenase [Spirochaetales bacterium]|jgi:L-iditol 2-dehydrogenase|nr:NAD(P)-dependent alcohol dehydrogenase [Spirochaetales bacterium]